MMKVSSVYLLCFCLLFAVTSATSTNHHDIVACRGSTVYLSSETNSSSHTHIPENYKWSELTPEYRSHYRWYKDGSLIGRFQDDRFEHVYRGVVIEDIENSDRGNYSLHEILPNDPGVVKITNFIVKVPDSHLELLVPNNITASTSDRVILKVKAKHSGSAIWYFQDQILRPSSKSIHYKFPFTLHYGFLFGSVLEIRKIQARHAGRYRLAYLVQGCQEHVDINVAVVKKSTKPFSNSFHPLFKALLTGKKLLRKMNTGTGKIIGIVALVVVGLILLTACTVSCITVYRRCIKKRANNNTNETKQQLLNNQQETWLQRFGRFFQRKRSQPSSTTNEDFKFTRLGAANDIENTISGDETQCDEINVQRNM